jgi:hypothetical protein
MVIRPATEDDLQHLLSLYATRGGAGQPLTLERVAEAFPRIHSDPCYTVYLALENGRAVGTFVLIIDTLGVRCAPEALLEDRRRRDACQGARNRLGNGRVRDAEGALRRLLQNGPLQ